MTPSVARSRSRFAPTLLLALALTQGALALTQGSLASRAFAQDTFTGVRRIVAVGDVHGDYDRFVGLLQRAGVVDARGQWSGGDTHLVQTGDVLDRGPDSRRAMDLLMRLETQAISAGGRVHALLGNHEVMNLQGDLRYVSDGEFAAMGDGPRGAPVPSAPVNAHAKLTAAFSATGVYGRWLRKHNTILKLNGTLFMHGGLSARYSQLSLKQLNDAVRAELAGRVAVNVSQDADGPLWYRGLAQDGSAAIAPLVARILTAQGANRIVLGHTIQDAGITQRLAGKVVLIDVGLSRWTSGAVPMALVITRSGTSERVSVVRGQ